jgi:hypothetical protein
MGTVINHTAVIGAHCDIKHGCTIGLRRSGDPSPVIDDGVVLGAGTHVLGAVRLGAGSETGVGAVVLQDAPAGWIAAGNPARVIERRALAQDVTLSTTISSGDESIVRAELTDPTSRSQSTTPLGDPGRAPRRPDRCRSLPRRFALTAPLLPPVAGLASQAPCATFLTASAATIRSRD